MNPKVYSKNILRILFLFASFSVAGAYAQSTYWQQKVDYKITAQVDDQKNALSGEEEITYFNNSPDTLKEIYFHLYWNSFSKGSHFFEKKLNWGSPSDNELRNTDYGEINIEEITIDNNKATFNVYESIGQIKLSNTLSPGKSIQFKIKFNSKIPSCIERAGKNNSAGTDFTFTQWYPKLCRYDEMGWHTDPYFGREFAGTFGSFDVKIICSKKFTVAGTGVLKNKEYTASGWSNINDSDNSKNETWEFSGENIHDFAFAMNKDWVHQKLTIDDINFHFFYHEDSKNGWTSLIENWSKAYAICKKEFGVYPYEQFSFIQAGEGYMEYPMCTMLEGGRFDFFSTACHEFMHNFFYGIYGSNENLHHWMDEGLTCYAEARISNVNGILFNPATSATSNYLSIRNWTTEEPISTAANHFNRNYAYYNAAYYKGQLFPELIRYIVGEKHMKKGFEKYYQNWRFKHPKPNDFVKIFEDLSLMELSWFENYWLNTTQTIDLSIQTVYDNQEGLVIEFENKGIPMPMEFSVKYKDGRTDFYYAPLDLTNNVKTDFLRPTTTLPKWSCARNKYGFTLPGVSLEDIEVITIDPDQFLPDVEEANNSYPETED